jgi:hypothetical protein
MDRVQDFAPDLAPDQAFGLTSAMAFDHLGNLFTFMDAHLGTMAIFDPESKAQERAVREAIRVGAKVCKMMTTDGKEVGFDAAVMREIWPRLVEASVVRK